MALFTEKLLAQTCEHGQALLSIDPFSGSRKVQKPHCD